MERTEAEEVSDPAPCSSGGHSPAAALGMEAAQAVDTCRCISEAPGGAVGRDTDSSACCTLSAHGPVLLVACGQPQLAVAAAHRVRRVCSETSISNSWVA